LSTLLSLVAVVGEPMPLVAEVRGDFELALV
jgi:hypothetical protein